MATTPRALFTPLTISSTVTKPFPSQSPMHTGPGVTAGDTEAVGVGLGAAPVAVGVRVLVGGGRAGVDVIVELGVVLCVGDAVGVNDTTGVGDGVTGVAVR